MIENAYLFNYHLTLPFLLSVQADGLFREEESEMLWRTFT